MNAPGPETVFLTKDLVQLMINGSIEAYDAKVSLPRHIENQSQMKGMSASLERISSVLTKIEGGFTAIKWIVGFASFAWTLTEITHAALNVVETLHR